MIRIYMLLIDTNGIDDIDTNGICHPCMNFFSRIHVCFTP
jgi:hypothetical protein